MENKEKEVDNKDILDAIGKVNDELKEQRKDLNEHMRRTEACEGRLTIVEKSYEVQKDHVNNTINVVKDANSSTLKLFWSIILGIPSGLFILVKVISIAKELSLL